VLKCYKKTLKEGLDVLLNIRVCVIVDSNKLVASSQCEVLDERRFACVKTLAKIQYKTAKQY
jgi:hypothetical protein